MSMIEINFTVVLSILFVFGLCSLFCFRVISKLCYNKRDMVEARYFENTDEPIPYVDIDRIHSSNLNDDEAVVATAVYSTEIDHEQSYRSVDIEQVIYVERGLSHQSLVDVIPVPTIPVAVRKSILAENCRHFNV